ncbi:MAG TPA: hypothetical protein VLT86_09800 [Vicinamibacterales bacterium]|nr:hypothetical protein [Vicinamibacterales bacterium]
MRAKTLTGLLAAGLLLIVTVHPAAQAPVPGERKLQLSFDRNGLVTLIAQNVTVREILAEWTRVGGTKMVNADRLTGGPITVQFEAQPESVVLESLLRPTAGWILYPRLEGNTSASIWQSVSILPSSHPTALYAPTPTSPQIAPVVQPMPDDEIPPVNPAQNAPAQTQPTQNRPTMPGVYVPSPGAPGTGTTGSGTTSTTGRGRGGMS